MPNKLALLINNIPLVYDFSFLEPRLRLQVIVHHLSHGRRSLFVKLVGKEVSLLLVLKAVCINLMKKEVLLVLRVVLNVLAIRNMLFLT